MLRDVPLSPQGCLLKTTIALRSSFTNDTLALLTLSSGSPLATHLSVFSTTRAKSTQRVPRLGQR
jgi:hypothetical protein